MAPDRSPVPDWCDAARYAALLHAEPSAIAWEWLRRDPLYRAAAAAARRGQAERPAVLPTDPPAAQWGLHAFEDPDLPALAARPVWRREWLGRVLTARAEPDGALEDRFELARFAAIATLVHRPGEAEHLLLSDGLSSLRLDIASGSLLEGPVCLAYCLAGFAGLRMPLGTLHGFLRLWQAGRLEPAAVSSRNRRLALLLRTWDALQAGATQREIAAVLLSGEASAARWRNEAPSLRSRAQRLAGGARAMADGGYRVLLKA